MRRFLLAIATVALMCPLTTAAYSYCSSDISAADREKDRMLDAYNRMNRAEDVVGKCTLLPKIIAKVEQNKARGLAVCRGPKDVVDRFVAAHNHDANVYRQVLRDECNPAAIRAADREKHKSSKDCEGKLSVTTEPHADSNCLFVVNSCGVNVMVRMQHSETRKPREVLVGSRPQRFCTIDKNWRWDFLGYRVAN